MQPSFPFSAIVGQEMLKRALLLGVIQPALGGVLIRGTKGLAKSTAVRALAGLLPDIETVAGCPFQRRPGEEIVAWPLPTDAPTITRPAPLVELPLGATEDRVLGSLHLERAVRGERVLEPGLLAAANRGILYIDEVNLLPDHLVDILLDAAASGMHRLEREGLSVSHPAHFLLIGTMNPEEGDLRPQLLDRFGLAADLADLTDAEQRKEAVRRRLAFEADPAGFAAAWQKADAREAERISEAQRLLPKVQLNEEMLAVVTRRCLKAGVEGLRADLALCRAASAWAAYQGRLAVEPDDVEAVAELALAHRRTRPPEPPRGGQQAADNSVADGGQQATNREAHESQSVGLSAECPPATIFDCAGLFMPQVEPPQQKRSAGPERGRGRDSVVPGPGPAAGMLRPYEAGCSLSWAATLRTAASARSATGPLVLCREDLRGRPRLGPAGRLLLFVVDSSGSMAAWRRMRQTKAAVLSLLVPAYTRRDRLALIAFHGDGAELVLPPARGLVRARRVLEQLPTGGGTPLAAGLHAAYRLVCAEQRRRPGQAIWVIVLTDGRANQISGEWRVTSDERQAALGGLPPWEAALQQARILAGCGADSLVVDTEIGPCRLGRAVALASALGARCLPLDDVLGLPLPDRKRVAV
jgi:magnesium chelatase subunit D